ncbi:hypothetical protein [Oryzobacter telluris]|uniref:hypothetical protein n=1 Tax=Oryzobacter telluris TaxID=3149179 RepID=UPI00370D3118
MPRRTLSVLTAAVTLGGLAVAAQPAVAAVSPAVNLTAMTIDGHPQRILPAPVEKTSGLQVPDKTRRLLQVTDGVSSHVAIEMPTGQDFAVGTYPAGAWGSPDATHGAMSVRATTGVGCSTEQGSFTIQEVAFAGEGGTGDLTRFAASYTYQCDEAEPVVGEVRWNSTVDYLRFGAVPLGRDATKTLTVTVPEAQTLGTAEIVDADSDSSRILGDTCSGETLAGGATCAVTVQAWPTQLEPSRALLTIPVDGGGAHLAPITLVGEETNDGTFTGLPAKRLLDTRSKVGVGTTTPIGAGKSIDVQVTGRGGVPSSGVSAVVLNLTAVAPTQRGYLTAYPSTAPRPTASSINFNERWTGANLVTVPIAAGGKVRIYNGTGSTHAIADVVGYYHSVSSTATSGNTQLGAYESIDPERLVDTRTAEWDRAPLGADEFLWTPVNFDAEFNPRIQAFALNITVVNPKRSGYVTAFTGNGPDEIPATSTLNFTAGRTVPNMAIVKVGQCYTECESPSAGIPRIGVSNGSPGSVHVIVDLVGVFFAPEDGDSGWRFRSLEAPTRFVDSRVKLGMTSNLGPNQSRSVVTPGSVAGYNTMAVVTNTTAARPSANTVLTLWPNSGDPRPGVSNLNPYAGQVVSNMTITEVWNQNDFRVHNVAGTTPVVIDAAGTFELYPPVGPPGDPGDGAPTTRSADALRSGPATSGKKQQSSVPTPTVPLKGAVERW